MGYACPVCETPQADGEHLANHLAMIAMLHGDAHEAWLDEHAPGWESSSPAELAERVVPHAPEREYPEHFEDTTGGAVQGHGGTHGHGGAHGGTHGHGGDPADGRLEDAIARQSGYGRDPGLTGDAAEIYAEARELTERMADEPPADPDETDDAEDPGEGGDDGGDGPRTDLDSAETPTDEEDETE